MQRGMTRINSRLD